MGKNKKGEWIAKNEITGKTYGKAFESIYDCQKYIDEELVFLQYEWKSLMKMEEYYNDEQDFQNWKSKNYKETGIFVIDTFQPRMQHFIENLFKVKDYDGPHRTNIIRAYNIKQNRWAEGLDF